MLGNLCLANVNFPTALIDDKLHICTCLSPISFKQAISLSAPLVSHPSGNKARYGMYSVNIDCESFSDS